MKLNEISPYIGRDPSSYRSGDEDNPRSPHYEEKVVEMNDEPVTILAYEIYNDDNDAVGKADISVKADGEFDLRNPNNGWDVSNIRITEVKLNGTTYTEEAFKKKFGDAIDMDLIKDDVKSDFDKHYDPTKNDDY